MTFKTALKIFSYNRYWVYVYDVKYYVIVVDIGQEQF